MDLRFIKVDSTFYRVETVQEHNGRKVFPCVASLSQNSYGRKLWQVDLEHGGRVLDAAGNDCFSFAVAKKLTREALTKR